MITMLSSIHLELRVQGRQASHSVEQVSLCYSKWEIAKPNVDL